MLCFAGSNSVNIITWVGLKGKGGRGSVEAAEDAEGAGSGRGDSETRRPRKGTKAAKIPFRALRSPSCHS
jgi:hypothetical protein